MKMQFGEANRNKALKQIGAALVLDIIGYNLFVEGSLVGGGIATISLILSLIGLGNLAYFVGTKKGKVLGVLSFFAFLVVYIMVAMIFRPKG